MPNTPNKSRRLGKCIMAAVMAVPQCVFRPGDLPGLQPEREREIAVRPAWTGAGWRIALFVPSLAGGGAERVVLEVARQLARRGCVVDLVVTRSGGALWESVPEDVRLINLNSWKTLTCLPALVRYIRRDRPSVLLSALTFGNLTALVTKKLFARHLRLIVSQHSTYTVEGQGRGITFRTANHLLKWLLPAADAIVAVSFGVAEDLKRAAPRAGGLISVIPNPVVSPALAEQAKLPLEHPWFGDPRTPVILTAGRLFIPQKDQPTLLRAFAEVLKSRPARLVVLGEGPDLNSLTTLARELGIRAHVDFAGFRPNPFAYMAKARVFVLSSVCEGLAIVLVEAMACGTSVISTDCPNGPREILEGGKWGRLVPVGDWRSLARAIRETLDRPVAPEHLIARANHYSVAAAMERYLELLNHVAPVAPAPPEAAYQ